MFTQVLEHKRKPKDFIEENRCETRCEADNSDSIAGTGYFIETNGANLTNIDKSDHLRSPFVKEESCIIDYMKFESSTDAADPLFDDASSKKVQGVSNDAAIGKKPSNNKKRRSRKTFHANSTEFDKIGLEINPAHTKDKTDKNKKNSKGQASESKLEKIAQHMRKLRARETPEETAARKMRERIRKMKINLLKQLTTTDEQLKAERAQRSLQECLKRKKKISNETPEEAEKRKLKERDCRRKAQLRQLAAEIPEETKLRHWMERNKRKENETAEEYNARKLRERAYNREYYKTKKLLRTRQAMSTSFIAEGNNNDSNSNN